MKFTLYFALLIFALAAPVYAADKPDAKKLYDTHCTGCHDTRIHTRPNRIVHVYSDLANRVKFCDAQVKSNFSEQELTAVTDYLNDKFYNFVKD